MALPKTAASSVSKKLDLSSKTALPDSTGELLGMAARYKLDSEVPELVHYTQNLERIPVKKTDLTNKLSQVLGKDFTDKKLNLNTSGGWAEVEKLLKAKATLELEKGIVQERQVTPSSKAKEIARKYNLTNDSAERLAQGNNVTASVASHTSAPQASVLNFSSGKKEESLNSSTQGNVKPTQSAESQAVWKRLRETADAEAKTKSFSIRREPDKVAGKVWDRIMQSLAVQRPELPEEDALILEQGELPETIESSVVQTVEQPTAKAEVLQYQSKPSKDIGVKSIEKAPTKAQQLISSVKTQNSPESIVQKAAKGKNLVSKLATKNPVGKVQKLKNLVKTGFDGIRAIAGDPRAIKNLILTALKSPTVRRIGKFLMGISAGIGAYGLSLLLSLGWGGLAGAVIGGVLGSVLGPVGIVAGAGAGAYIGANIGAIATGIQASIAGFFSGIGVAATGVWATITGGSMVAATSILSVLSVGVTFAVVWVGQGELDNAFFSYAAETSSIVQVKKTVDKSSLPNNPNDKVVYTIEITTESVDDVPITIDDKTIQITPTKETISLVMPPIAEVIPPPDGGNSKTLPTTVSKSSPIKIVYEPLTIVGSQFNDSIVKNVVAVTGGSEEQSETVSAEADVIIGSVIDPPYGYPMSGEIMSLDDEPISAKENNKYSNRPHGSLGVDGGIDISPRSSDIGIYSTLTGKVIRSSFDKTFGGVVQIQTGSYIATFMHMADAGRPEKDSAVVRGTKIGNLYMGHDLANASGPHLHYQVLRDGRNLFFGAKRESETGQINYGPCLINGVRTNFIQPAPPLSNRPVFVGRLTDCTEAGGFSQPPPNNTNICPLAPSGNACSIENMRRYFPTEAAADKASRICYRESRGIRTALNDGCSDSPQRHNEYSVGLFQINLAPQAHPDMCPEGTFLHSKDACVFNKKLRDECFAKWTSQTCGTTPNDPLNDCNIKKAVELSNGGVNWGPWSTSRPGVCNIQ